MVDTYCSTLLWKPHRDDHTYWSQQLCEIRTTFLPFCKKSIRSRKVVEPDFEHGIGRASLLYYITLHPLPAQGALLKIQMARLFVQRFWSIWPNRHVCAWFKTSPGASEPQAGGLMLSHRARGVPRSPPSSPRTPWCSDSTFCTKDAFLMLCKAAQIPLPSPSRRARSNHRAIFPCLLCLTKNKISQMDKSSL